MSYNMEEQIYQITKSNMTYENDASDIEYKGYMMQPQSGPGFLTVLRFACEALIACTRQLNIMDKECGDGNYGTALAQGANAIKVAIKKDEILATRPSVTFAQISRIVEKEMEGSESRIYSLFFYAAAKEGEQLTANIWLTALTSANKTISDLNGALIGNRTGMLDALIPAEHKLREALDSGLNPVKAFGEAVNAAETSAMQTVHSPRPYTANSANHMTFKYPDPGAHAVGVWMRAAYEGVKLKFVEYDV